MGPTPTMGNAPMGLDEWRGYFRTSNSDIFSVIEHAMLVAALDCPYDFKLKRDRMAEILFACKFSRCYGCDEKLKIGAADEARASDNREVMEMVLNNNNNNNNINKNINIINNNNVINISNSNKDYGYGEDAEALTDEIEQDSLFHEEVLRIRGIVENCDKEPDEVLIDSLRRLQLMPLSVESLKITDIGRPVNALRKHRSKEIRNLVRALIDNWKRLVEEWVNAAAAIEADAEATPESVRTTPIQKEKEEEEEEEGLPSPPLDEGAFFTTPVPMELSQFFDGMDEDGNPQKCVELNKNRENVRNRRPEKTDIAPKRDSSSRDRNAPPYGRPKDELKRNQEPVLRRQDPPSKPVGRSHVVERGPVRPKPVEQVKSRDEVMAQPKSDKGTYQKKPTMSHHQDQKLRGNEEVSVRDKLEAAKRKLHERYQEVDNAKRQRTIKVVEPRDLPKQSHVRRNQYSRPGSYQQHRQWSSGRRR